MAARKLAPCPTRKCLKETTWIDFNHVWTANIFRKMTTNEAIPSWLIRGVSYVTLYWCKLHPLSKCNCWIGFIPVRLLHRSAYERVPLRSILNDNNSVTRTKSLLSNSLPIWWLLTVASLRNKPLTSLRSNTTLLEIILVASHSFQVRLPSCQTLAHWTRLVPCFDGQQCFTSNKPSV